MIEGQVSFNPATHAALVIELEFASAAKRYVDELRDTGHLAVVKDLRADAGVVADIRGQVWTGDMLQQLAASEMSNVMQTVLDFLAERSPSVVGYQELLRATQLEEHPLRLRAELAAFTKLTQRLFSFKIWPMDARQGLGRGATTMAYLMPKEIADVWKKHSGAASRHVPDVG